MIISKQKKETKMSETTKCHFKPLGLNVLLKEIKEEHALNEVIDDGIIMPQSVVAAKAAQGRTIIKCEVVRVGDGKDGLEVVEDFSNMPVGTIVMIGNHAGMPVFDNGVEYRMVERKTIIGIVEKD